MDMDCLGRCFSNRSSDLCDRLLVPASTSIPVRIDASAATQGDEARSQRLDIFFNVSTDSALSLIDAKVTGGQDNALPTVGLVAMGVKAPGQAEWEDVWPSTGSPVRVAAGSTFKVVTSVSVAPLFAYHSGSPPPVRSGAVTVREPARRAHAALFVLTPTLFAPWTRHRCAFACPTTHATSPRSLPRYRCLFHSLAVVG